MALKKNCSIWWLSTGDDLQLRPIAHDLGARRIIKRVNKQ